MGDGISFKKVVPAMTVSPRIFRFLLLLGLTSGSTAFSTCSLHRVSRDLPKNLHQKARIISDVKPYLAMTSSSTSEDSASNPSQLESILGNAKSLLTDGERSDTKNKLYKATVAGLAVSLAMVPEAIAFSFVAGVSPLVGLWTTVALGFTAATLGGRAGICSSASGACSVVVASLCKSHGPAYLSACAILAGILQAAGGFLGLGKFIRLVRHPVMLGFVNGVAIVMTKAQLVHFRGPNGGFASVAV
jgi:hypothetical protein